MSAAATATAITTVAATTATAAATTAATATTTAAFLRTGFIHGEIAAFNVLAIECGDRVLRLLIGAHFDETEAFGASGFTVGDHLRRLHRTVFGKHLFQVVTADTVAQVAYI